MPRAPSNPHAVPNATVPYPGEPKNGGSNPRFYDFDDGVTRLVKWHPSAHGTKACYNELVASRLGQLLDAPILRGCVVFVGNDVIPEDHRKKGAKEGFHFGVSRMFGTNFVPAHYESIENDSELAVAAVLLAWLDVGDQESHNQYLQQLVLTYDVNAPTKPTRLFRLIDMGQMFRNWNWTAESVVTVQTTYKLPPEMVKHLTKEKLEPAFAELRQVPHEAIRGCFRDAPSEWNVTEDEIAAGAKRAIEAAVNIESIVHNGNKSLWKT
jgi:hypothetical protein